MDAGWRFALGDACNAEKDFNNGTSYFSYFAKAGYGDGAASGNFDDRAWRIVDLPHDWAVELPFDPKGGHSHGYRALGRNFPENSIGWYRKTFSIPASDLGKRISIDFDGVFRNSIVWVNGFYLGQEHSGYASFSYDISDYLNYGGDNVVAVRVDATMEEGWFYEGAGIYRHTWLTKTSPLHVARYGTFVSSAVKEKFAKVSASATIANDGTKPATFEVEQNFEDAEGKSVGKANLEKLTLSPGAEGDYVSSIGLANPTLWSIETPYLYKLITTVRSGGVVVDRYETPFGIRTLHFDANKGFFLNGKHLKLKGTNNHQDHAGVGTAIPDALQEFRVKRLKEMGSNAYRCSHNPPTPELLDACDRLGMLVIDENRLTGTNQEHLDLLKGMILRDRNHPCVFAWSIGNEEWAIEGNITGARIASTMQAFAQRIDSTRYITYANSGGWGHGISTVAEVMGFNYIFNGNIDKQHADFPNQPSMGTEETTSRGTRGQYVDDKPNAHMQATDREPGGYSMETGLKFYDARPFLSGLFFWTGFDYRGEPNPIGWPQVGSQSGIVDQCGFPKDMFYYLKSWWGSEPVVHLLPHWNWKGNEGQEINVWAYSNCDEVELFLNKKSLGRQTMPKDSHLEWKVKYVPGTLLARGFKNGKEVCRDQVETTGEPVAVQLVPDRTSVKADGQDVSVITVEAKDAKGRPVPTAGNEIEFSLEGPGRIIGVGNGDPSSHDPDKYLETVSSVKIENLREKAVAGKTGLSEVAFDTDDSNWKPAFPKEGFENKSAEDSSKIAVIRGAFVLPEFTDKTQITLLTKSLGEMQDIYVNGQLIAKDIKRDAPGQSYKLDHALLRPGKNIFALVVNPLKKRNQWEELNTDPGMVQVITPAPVWKRKLFNGLAQVIVRSSNESGEMILTARSAGLAPSVIKLEVGK
jgi:beta-galactosidase